MKKFRAWFITDLGKRFSRVFETGEEMEAFIYRAAEVGTRLTGFVSI